MGESGPQLSVVIPAFDEVERLPPTLARLRAFRAGRDVEVIVVDDGSRDGTAAAAEALLEPGDRVLRLARNRGKGAAVRAGVLASRGARVLVTDADLSTPLEELAKLEAALAAGAQVAVASRSVPGAELPVRQGPMREALGRAFNHLVRALGLSRLHDTQCGFKLLDGDTARSLFASLENEGFAFDVEVLARAERAGLAIAEVPVVWRNDADSRVRALAGARAFADLARIWRKLKGEDWLAPRATEFALALTLAVLVGARWLGLGAVPVLDTSEARYAAIAERMADTGDWVTPRLPDGTPFWGKPPLHLWLQAASFRAFGQSELTARVPSAAGELVVIAATLALGLTLGSRRMALLAAVLVASMALTLGLSALAITDMTFSACIAAALACFAFATGLGPRGPSRVAGLGFFAALGLGMLAKGPVALALAGGAIALFSVWQRSLAWMRSLPWVLGPLLFFAVASPWYLLAELRTPGFLNYFLVHENFLRFVSSSYGDLYGDNHSYPYGTIWGFALLAILPWSGIALASCFSRELRPRLDTPARRFAASWALAAPLFFTPARNVVSSYVMPSLPGFAALAALVLAPLFESRALSPAVQRLSRSTVWLARAVPGISAACGAGVLVGLGAGWLDEIALVLVFPLLVAPLLWLGRATPRGSVLAACVGLALLDATARFALADELARERSARTLANDLSGRRELAGCGLHFYADVPLSATFYFDRDMDSFSKQFARVTRESADAGCDVVVFRPKDLARLARDGRDLHLEPVVTRGAYLAFLDGEDRPGRATTVAR